MSKPLNFSEFFSAMCYCALWSSSDEHGEPLCLDFDVSDIAPATLAHMRDDAADFWNANQSLLVAYNERMGNEEHSGSELAGHDFWLTSNGHGVGFWNRGLGGLGDALTTAAEGYGGRFLYVGDDGMVY